MPSAPRPERRAPVAAAAVEIGAVIVPTPGATASRRRASKPKAPTPRMSSYRQAVAFLAWLQGTGFAGRRIEGFDEIERLYLDWARQAGVVAREWQPIGCHFTGLIQRPGKPRRMYGWRRCEWTGDRTRIRLYHIPPVPIAAATARDADMIGRAA